MAKHKWNGERERERNEKEGGRESYWRENDRRGKRKKRRVHRRIRHAVKILPELFTWVRKAGAGPRLGIRGLILNMIFRIPRRTTLLYSSRSDIRGRHDTLEQHTAAPRLVGSSSTPIHAFLRTYLHPPYPLSRHPSRPTTHTRIYTHPLASSFDGLSAVHTVSRVQGASNTRRVKVDQISKRKFIFLSGVVSDVSDQISVVKILFFFCETILLKLFFFFFLMEKLLRYFLIKYILIMYLINYIYINDILDIFWYRILSTCR